MRRPAGLAIITALALAVLTPASAAAGAPDSAAAAPSPPKVTAGFTQTTAQPLGATLTFTIAQSGTGSDAAKEFVWGLDSQPPTSETTPAGQTCTTTAATSECTKISSGKATLKISVPSPGSHNLWVYERNSAGANSATTNGAPSGQAWTFSGAGDAQAAYTAGASLAANFAAAVAADGSTMISSSSRTSCGAGSGDGTGTDFDAFDLGDAGWGAGKTVTIDGASFTVPGYGSCAHDNLLAADQEIGTGPAGAHGSALVILATSTDAHVQAPGSMSGAPDSGVLADDATVPSVMGGYDVTGSGCAGATAFATSQSQCVPASGTVSYASGCPDGTQTGYDLTVPDWVAGPTDLAAVQIPQVVGTGGVSVSDAMIYSFAVPVDAACTITSVGLPDVGATVDAHVAGGGSTAVSERLSGLHIIGLALRNTTTATPEPDGSSAASPPGQAWTGAFASPIEYAAAAPSTSANTWGDQTIRIALSPNVSAPAGTSDVRIRLENPGFFFDGPGPLIIGAASIAQASSGAVPAQTPVPLTFAGSSGATIPEGGDVYSDPLALPFAVTAGHDLLVSLWLENSYLPALPENTWASGAQTWIAPDTVPNETGDTTGTPFTGPGSSLTGSTAVLTGVDVTTPAATLNGQASPGAPTVVVAGDNVIDGGASQAESDAQNAPSERLAGQLASQGLAPGFGVVDAGIESNQVVSDGDSIEGEGSGGVSLLSRLDRDILAEPDVGTVIIDEGLEDLLQVSGGGSIPLAEFSLEDAYGALETQLNAFGINVIIGTLTPCAGYVDPGGDSCTTGVGSSSVDGARQGVNSAIENTSSAACWVNFDAAVSNGASPEALLAADNAGDDVNLTLAGSDSGYAVLARAVFTSPDACSLLPSHNPLPARQAPRLRSG